MKKEIRDVPRPYDDDARNLIMVVGILVAACITLTVVIWVLM